MLVLQLTFGVSWSRGQVRIITESWPCWASLTATSLWMSTERDSLCLLCTYVLVPCWSGMLLECRRFLPCALFAGASSKGLCRPSTDGYLCAGHRRYATCSSFAVVLAWVWQLLIYGTMRCTSQLHQGHSGFWERIMMEIKELSSNLGLPSRDGCLEMLWQWKVLQDTSV